MSALFLKEKLRQLQWNLNQGNVLTVILSVIVNLKKKDTENIIWKRFQKKKLKEKNEKNQELVK